MHSALDCLTQLNVGHSKGFPAPNKPCLLLAIICEIQSGHIASARIPIDTRLLSRYHDLYEIVTGDRHKASPWLPLWHLRSDQGASGPLWLPLFTDAIRAVAEQLGQPKSIGQIEQRFREAKLDDALFTALQDRSTAHEAAALLISRFFAHSPDIQSLLYGYMASAYASGEYEKHPEQLKGEVREISQTPARSAAFRALVLEAYDYRCAASRRRFITPDFRYLAQAAHLVPFSISQDDRPTNGLALTPDLHWAMDNLLIAPGPDLKWHVSKAVDELVEDNQWLWRLDGKSLYLPQNACLHPHDEGLQWRMDHLQH